jgi:hypothetical protein
LILRFLHDRGFQQGRIGVYLVLLSKSPFSYCIGQDESWLEVDGRLASKADFTPESRFGKMI